MINKFKADGHEGVKISESIDIAPSTFYHGFEDKNGKKLGTYQIYSLTTPFNIDRLNLLTEEQKDNAIYLLEHRDEIEAQEKIEIAEHNAELRQNIIDNNETNLSVKSAMLLEIDVAEANISMIDTDELKLEIMEDRVNEWVQYKELEEDFIEINTTQVSLAYAQHIAVSDINTSTIELNPLDTNITVKNDINDTIEKRVELRGCCRSLRRRIKRVI